MTDTSSFYASLSRQPSERTNEDISSIYNHLRKLEVFERLSDAPLRSVCRTARLEKHPANYVLFRYILLSGSVFMNSQIYLPVGCFGKRSNMNLRRNSDCICVQPSDVIVIDYPDVQRITVHLNNAVSNHSSSNIYYPSGQIEMGPSAMSYPSTSSQCQQNCRSANSGLAYNLSAPHHYSQISHKQRGTLYLNSAANNTSCSHEKSKGSSVVARVPSPAPMAGVHMGGAVICSPFAQKHLGAQHRPVPPPPVSEWPSGPPPRLPPRRSKDNIVGLQRHHIPQNSSAQIMMHQKFNSLSDNSLVNSEGQQFVTATSPLNFCVNNIPLKSTVTPTRNYLSPPPPSSVINQPTNTNSNVLQKRNIFEQNQNAAQSTAIPGWSPVKISPVGLTKQETQKISPQKSPSTESATVTSNSNNSQRTRPQSSMGQRYSTLQKLPTQSSKRISSVDKKPQEQQLIPNCSNSKAKSENIDIHNHTQNGISTNVINKTLTVTQSSRGNRIGSVASASTDGDIDEFSGLPETVVDESDDDDEEESCPSHDSFVELRDCVRECLEKEPSERSSEDIAILMEFVQQMPALASLPQNIQRQLCLKMVFAVVPRVGTVILRNNEKIDAWSVVVNGAVEHIKHSTGERVEYRLGDCFGAQAIAQTQFHDGDLRTLVDDCEFVLVEHPDFYQIMSTFPQHIERESDTLTGELVREVERRVVGPSNVELVILKAGYERLIQHLIYSEKHETHFIEDFLLMHRVFQPDPTVIARRMIESFQDNVENALERRAKIARILLLWLNNHFCDWENNAQMNIILDEFEQLMEQAKMHSQLSLVNITCSAKSHPRTITLTRSNRDEELSFCIIGGIDIDEGIYVQSVQPGSLAEKARLKKGDEILEVNGQNFHLLSLANALELMRKTTLLSMVVRANRMGFKEVQASNQRLPSLEQDQVDSGVESPVLPHKSIVATRAIAAASGGGIGRYQKKSSAPSMLPLNAQQNNQDYTIRRSTLNAVITAQPDSQANHTAGTKVKTTSESITTRKESSASGASGSGTLGKNTVLSRLLNMVISSHSTNNSNQEYSEDFPDEISRHQTLRASRSNPDISSNLLSSSTSSSTNHRHSFALSVPPQEQVIKVYRCDQSFRYLSIYPDTDVRLVIQLALQEFGIAFSPEVMNQLEWSLYECSVSREGVIKQRRLPDGKSGLADQISLNSRLYLRNMNRSEALIPDELASEVLKESRLNLYTLNAQFIATQLTLQDFAVFSSIGQTEFVDRVFQLGKAPNLSEFEDMFNREMFWVATEVVCERNVYRRSKLIKKFIKIARHCRDLRNLNSMFAIVSGLEKPSVRRLTHTWERVPGKYLKMLGDVQQLMDPSRNMSRYRAHLAQASQDPPVIPIYPVIIKDLIFSHEANPTFSKKLINFEKLRMIASIIRQTTRLGSVPYDEELVMGQQILADVDSGTVLRRTGPGQIPLPVRGNISRKKLYERALMLRKVKAYLGQMPVINSEAELDRISLECEPPALVPPSSSHGSAIPIRKRMPSPSPSSLSSHSNQSLEQRQRVHVPKFGMESPQAVQKMLALVQNSKVAKIPHSSRGFSPASALQKNVGSRSARQTNLNGTVQQQNLLPPTGKDKFTRTQEPSSAEPESNERVIL